MLKNKKQLIALGVVLSLLAAFAAYKTALNFVGVPGKLYQYYPVSTGFYLELAPGEKLTRRFVAFLDNQAAQEEKSTDRLETTENSKKALSQEKAKLIGKKAGADGKTAPPLSHEQSIQDQSHKPKAALPEQPRPKNFRRIFLSKFNSTFEPYVSLGIWPDPDLAGTELQTSGGHTLVVLP